MSTEEIRIGIVIPTWRRPRLLAKCLRNLQRQACTSWECIVVHDEPISFDVVDPRIQYVQTVDAVHDYGASARLLGIQTFLKRAACPDYLVFWDDDDFFHDHALNDIQHAVNTVPQTDLLLVPFRIQNRILPTPTITIDQLGLGAITTANFVFRPSIAEAAYQAVVNAKVLRATDFHAFIACRDTLHATIKRCDGISPIGQCDGLLFFPSLFIRLGLPSFAYSYWSRNRFLAFIQKRILRKFT